MKRVAEEQARNQEGSLVSQKNRILEYIEFQKKTQDRLANALKSRKCFKRKTKTDFHEPHKFIAAAVQTAFEFEGIYNLMKMWVDETDQKEKDEIVADIQNLIDDWAPREKVEGVNVRFDDLETISNDVRKFKDNLRIAIDKNDGIKKLAELTGIPQPSLSRFFDSATMPRRATLLKIARALNLSQIEIATEWSQ